MKSKIICMVYSIIIGIMVLSISIIFVTKDIKRFENKYYRYNISKRTEISKYESIKIVNQTIDYVLYDDYGNIISNYYSMEELIHLKDVQQIFWIIRFVEKISMFLFILISIIIYRLKDKDKIRKIKKYILVITTVSIASFVLLAINFRNNFYIFHNIIFSNEFWLLDINRSLLVALMPETLFYHLFLKIITIYTLILIIFKIILSFIDKLCEIRV